MEVGRAFRRYIQLIPSAENVDRSASGKSLQSIALGPIVMNYVGEGQPDIHNAYTNNEFLDTRGLRSPATAREPVTYFSA